MSFEIEEDNTAVADYVGICPKCGSTMTFYHDLKCAVCDQKKTLWCPRCLNHRRLKV